MNEPVATGIELALVGQSAPTARPVRDSYVEQLTSIRQALDKMQAEMDSSAWEKDAVAEFREKLEEIIEAVVGLHRTLSR